LSNLALEGIDLSLLTIHLDSNCWKDLTINNKTNRGRTEKSKVALSKSTFNDTYCELCDQSKAAPSLVEQSTSGALWCYRRVFFNTNSQNILKTALLD
jgi:hypothetical protein